MQWLWLKKQRVWVALLLLLALIALGSGVSAAAGRAGRDVEVVYDRPLRVGSLPVAGLAVVDEAEGIARASLTEPFFDFGNIPAAGQVQHEFLLRNQGSAPLVIRQAYTTCGCTTADFSASVIPPGKASRVTVRFDAGFHSLAGITVRRGLIIESNDPHQPQVEIWIQASIK